ncbi:nuclear transport factor 2 family protein [Euryhalocaulis caribicus]|uniref:nuclear transport factor 2 family protein n=1 Tax=Euryhalocaulis caribicus TaxID=1161401 RepID=UPI00039C702F|nr:nuclear transport factor 2 family protein [Euryhalocaulis caribicus]
MTFIAMLAAAAVAQSAAADAETLAALDAKLFEAGFETCELDVLEDLIAEDFEFYHDVDGQVADNRDEFIAVIAGNCADWRNGKRPASRRGLDAMETYPMQGYGALQVGAHSFYEKPEGEAERRTGHAKFSHLWKRENGEWRLTRVLSYDHAAAD